MEVIRYPDRSVWPQLCLRPTLEVEGLTQSVETVMQGVKDTGDEAVRNFTKKFDSVELKQLVIKKDQIQAAREGIPVDLQSAIQLAAKNIGKFHETQLNTVQQVKTAPGVSCWRKSVPIESVGLYIPGGTAPLFSSLLMLAIPAKIAGCKNIVVCTPPQVNGTAAREVLYAASLLDIDRVYTVGGAQAVAAMCFGTESIPAVNKIFGPGNQYVTEAKMQALKYGTAIDMPAGPSEVLIIADAESRADFVAADLLSQAEHGTDSQVMLISDNEFKIQEISVALHQQITQLPRAATAKKALENSKAILVGSLNEAMDFSNRYAPEHLILATKNAELLADEVTQAGSVFLGTWSCESAGDYASGTNHTLPTNGFAANYSGVSVDSFVKKITFQQLSEEGIKTIGPAVTIMARAEQLDAHANAMLLRQKALGYV